MKEINIVTTEKRMIPSDMRKVPITHRAATSPTFSPDTGKETGVLVTYAYYPIRKMCTVLNNELTVKEYAIADPFLEEIINRKDREWRKSVEMHNIMINHARRLQEKADEDRKLYSYILAHPFKYALRRLFKLDAPEGSIG